MDAPPPAKGKQKSRNWAAGLGDGQVTHVLNFVCPLGGEEPKARLEGGSGEKREFILFSPICSGLLIEKFIEFRQHLLGSKDGRVAMLLVLTLIARWRGRRLNRREEFTQLSFQVIDYVVHGGIVKRQTHGHRSLEAVCDRIAH